MAILPEFTEVALDHLITKKFKLSRKCLQIYSFLLIIINFSDLYFVSLTWDPSIWKCNNLLSTTYFLSFCKAEVYS